MIQSDARSAISIDGAQCGVGALTDPPFPQVP
jgi:hypothetical protein